LAVSKTGPRFATAGQVVTYRIKVTNRGSIAARNLSFSDVLPSGFALASRSSGGKLVNGRVTWKAATLRPGASRTVTLRVRLSRDLSGRRCNVALAAAANAARVRDVACTRIAAVAGAIAPAVTG
jgi:uncharacterized repeat protein (TIGR01451 family)